MGVQSDSGGKWLMGFRGLTRRKQVDSEYVNTDMGHHGLAKRLTIVDLVGIGVGSTIGAGVYILIGEVAREHTGPALAIAFLIAGIAAALSAFCYAELSSRWPSAGSAYHYSYICIGEGIAWIVGWGLILEYAIGGSVVARGVTPNLALYFGGEENLPLFLARQCIFGIVVDPCAAALVIIATILLCCGIKESTLAQTTVTAINICALLFVILVGGYLAFKNGWSGYELSDGYFPFGVNGLFAGSATVFFSYIGFDAVTATAEEDITDLFSFLSFNVFLKLVQQVKNPRQDLPWGIGISLSLSCVLYMLVSFVIVGLVPYYKLDEDTPISTAFSQYGITWAAYIITTGAVMALVAALMGSLLPQSRILMAMARDGLLPTFFSDIDKHTHVPVKGTIATGILAALLAFFMDVSELAGMVSVGTLLAFTAVAVSVLIIRYIPPKGEVLRPFIEGSSSAPARDGYNIEGAAEDAKGPFVLAEGDFQALLEKKEPLHESGIDKEASLEEPSVQQRRNLAPWLIGTIYVGVLVLIFAASAENAPSFSRITLSGLGAVIFLAGVMGLAYIGEDGAVGRFRHKGGFTCPLVPCLPAASILINTYLLVNLGAATWLRVSIWLLIGVFIYLFYGRTNSSLLHGPCIPITRPEDLCHSSVGSPSH
ncbi:hypothetical protein Cgig2_002072 [Carnegiea gigantea]|uniref:Cationic amino acid transporter C-terminal domain-containing protein n=1 Tax=Carnegiea gigantea TaxID=171969 RepID=A0A9Q1JUS4_9CARY|nr:hypothetical protein Cgig2_002072 [Carnegiea gigantea]